MSANVTGSSLRDALASRPIIGSFVGIGHPAAVELMAWAGFDVVCVDTEHSSIGPTEVEHAIRAADACGVATLVRVWQPGAEIGRALDAGAAGVVVPRVESAAQASAGVAAMRYPPRGIRGAGPGRASRYGAELSAQIQADGDVMVIVQIETVAGVANASAIAAVEGIDIVFVGPGDLAVSLDAQPGSRAHVEAIDEILGAARAAGVASGIFCAEPREVADWVGRGVRLILVGADLMFLANAAARAVRDARDALLRT